ncbi:UNVERIFIED_CONTAM: Stemmadenine O-acetyltransferase [Sesamum angustifolium]|uniref:Stemmadenine O-acetyltransferase n=1 Tax=Sesamum angustifolium TaxID=2727405 RepID=A0AAW2M8W2_9LAMI
MSTTALSDASNAAFHDLVSKLRSAIKKVNDDYIREAKTGDSYLNDVSKLVSPIMNGELELCAFSSWCRYPVYEVDYGWGNPISFCTSFAPMKNTVILVNSRSGDGIEALIAMPNTTYPSLKPKSGSFPVPRHRSTPDFSARKPANSRFQLQFPKPSYTGSAFGQETEQADEQRGVAYGGGSGPSEIMF